MLKPEFRSDDFLGPGDELNYLNDVIRYESFVGNLKSESAKKSIKRFEILLKSRGDDNGSIILQSHWSLLHEINKDYKSAVASRSKEADLVLKCLKLGGEIGPITIQFYVQVLQSLLRNYHMLGDEQKVVELSDRIKRVNLNGLKFE